MKKALVNGAVLQLSPSSKMEKLMDKFNDVFTAAVNSGSASVSEDSTTVKNPIADKDGKNVEIPYSYPKVVVKDLDGAIAYFSKTYEYKDSEGKTVTGVGYRSADGKTVQNPTELVFEALSSFITNKEKASARAAALSAAVPEDTKAILSAAKKMVAAGKFGGKVAEDMTSDANVAAVNKAVAVLTAAAEAGA